MLKAQPQISAYLIVRGKNNKTQLGSTDVLRDPSQAGGVVKQKNVEKNAAEGERRSLAQAQIRKEYRPANGLRAQNGARRIDKRRPRLRTVRCKSVQLVGERASSGQ